MAGEKRQSDQFGKGGDAALDGGASADRGGRDAGTPGPDPGAGTAGAKNPAEASKGEDRGTGSPGTPPTGGSRD